MSDQPTNVTLVWASLLTCCEGKSMDLTAADETVIECAEQMQDAGLLICTGASEWTLSQRGMELLSAVERLRDFSLHRL